MALLLAVLAGWCGKTKGHLQGRNIKALRCCRLFAWRQSGFVTQGTDKKTKQEGRKWSRPRFRRGVEGGREVQGYEVAAVDDAGVESRCAGTDDVCFVTRTTTTTTIITTTTERQTTRKIFFWNGKKTKKIGTKKMKIKKTELKRKKTELMQTEIGVERVQARTWRLGPQLRGALN